MRMDRREFLKAVGAGAASLALTRLVPGAATGAAKRPNVVLVITDDQGYGDLGCHGNDVIRTPNLDRLHTQSVRLTDFHVAPTCAPTRAGLMTGRWCNRTGVWHTIMGRSMLRKGEVTLADVFAAGGWRTGIFGKWHLGDNYPFRPQDRGFQEVWVNGGGGVGQTPDYWGNNYFDDTYFHNGKPVACKGYCTDVWFDKAMAFIEANKDKPLFCYIPTNAPHGPYLVAEKYSKPYRDKGVKGGRAAFYGMITNIDENMGRLMAKLDALGIADNTILIFMTDNGTSSGASGGMRGRKGSEYDGGHRVPCFLRWPAGKLGGGRDVGRLTAHTDLLPTLAELCGLKAPNVKLDGASIVPLLRGAEWPERTLIADSQRIEHPEKWRKSAVMTDRWRLVNGKELFDMPADPAQKTNVADKHPEVVARLGKAYEAWWTDTSKRFGEYCGTILGSDHENPVRITCHDWHGQRVPWNQGAVRSGAKANGFWAVEVERAGKYEFSLRRWPEELDQPITAAIPRGKAISATKARLKIGDVDEAKPIADGAKAVTFTVELKPGKARLQTWLSDEKGEERGAYYVYVKRLS